MYYRKKYTPRPGDYNKNNNLAYEAILQILESIAGIHSASVGDSVADLSRNKISWILAEWHIKFIRHPENGEDLSITTWVRGKTPASTVFRDFLVYDEDGSEVIRAEAKFALYDLESSKLTRINEELFASYQPEEKVIFEDVQKLRVPSEYEAETKIQLRRSDIDFNGHVHNTRYMDYALQALPKEIYDKNSFSEIKIIYRKAITEEDNVALKYLYTDSRANVGIYGNDVLCCLVEFS